MYVITSGRVRVLLEDDAGEQSLLNVLDRGAHFGELSMLIGSPRNATIKTVVDTDLLVLNHDHFAEAVEQVPQFAVNLSKTLGRWLRGELLGTRRQVIRAVFAVIRTRKEHAALAPQMVKVFKERGAVVKVVTDRAQDWPSHDVLAELVHGRDLEPLRDRVADAVTQGVRVLVDCDVATAEPSLLRQCEHILWLFDNQDQGLVDSRLGTFVRDQERLAGHSQVVWTHRRSVRLPRHASHDLPLPGSDMRVQWEDDSGEPCFREHDVGRCVHCVDGLQFGLAAAWWCKGVALVSLRFSTVKVFILIQSRVQVLVPSCLPGMRWEDPRCAAAVNA